MITGRAARSVSFVLAVLLAVATKSTAQVQPQTPPVNLPPVEVVATRRPEAAHDVPASIEVISGNDLRARGAKSLKDALGLATGVAIAPGGDAAQVISDYFPRIAEVHLKDTYAKYRGNTSTPTQEEHRVASVYHNLGGGGVDFVAVFKVLRDRHYKGWAIFDVDGPRKGDDGFDSIGGNLDVAVDDYLSHNINYLRNVLGIKLPPIG